MHDEYGKNIEAIKQRTLKITEALYRTSDIMFDGEPLKWSLRNSALDILNSVTKLNASGQIQEIDKINNMVQGLFLKLELAASGTFISKVNFEVLQREYAMLQNRVVEQSKELVLLDLPPVKQTEPLYQTQSDISDNRSKQTEQVQAQEVQEKRFVPVQPNNTDRREVIVSALKENGPSSVGDLAKLFNGTIGEKTVQRELNAMVEVGAVQKEGEKRWRRYFL